MSGDGVVRRETVGCEERSRFEDGGSSDFFSVLGYGVCF